MPPFAIQQALQHVVQLLEKGRLREAEALFRQILAQRPNDPELLHQHGLLLIHMREGSQAAEVLRRAIAINPKAAVYHNHLGVALAMQGQGEQAIAAYRQALALDRDYPEALCNLGNALQTKGDLAEAIEALQRATALRPDFVEAHVNLGSALRAAGRLPEAQRALEKTLVLQPTSAEAHLNLGSVLQAVGRQDQAIAHYQRALATRPDYPEAHFNIGYALHDEGKLPEAIAAFDRALAQRPDYPEAHCERGTALQKSGQVDAAIAGYRRALAIRPDFIPARYNLALALLLQGRFQEGWKEYEARWRMLAVNPASKLRQPWWDGSDIHGRRILLWAEQGLGDTIQFLRYVPLVAARGGRVLLQCQPQLHSLLREQKAIEQLLGSDDPLPDYDVHCPLMSLPRLLSTTVQTIPAIVPYLCVDPNLVRQCSAALGDKPELKIGLNWAGSPHNRDDRNRSLPVEALAPLAQVPGVRLFSLQKGFRGPGPFPMQFLEATENFAGTAAVIANLDLVITCDTSIAHLAGALGRPVWTLLPFAPDWRWMLDRADTPWYPTMRLFRQPSRGDWTTPVRQIAERLGFP